MGNEVGADNELSITVKLTFLVNFMRLEHVFDLRQKTSQQWLVDEFAKADNDVLIKKDRAGLSSFSDLLPTLLDNRLGGNVFTDALGFYLRAIGADGIIYPSARCDSGAAYKSDKLLYSSGWNFLNYSDTVPTGPMTFNDLTQGWRTDFVIDAIEKIQKFSELTDEWYMKGLAKHTLATSALTSELFRSGTTLDEIQNAMRSAKK